MVVKLISANIVRLAVRHAADHHENTKCIAVSSPYHPALNYDGTLIHGSCIIFWTKGPLHVAT